MAWNFLLHHLIYQLSQFYSRSRLSASANRWIMRIAENNATRKVSQRACEEFSEFSEQSVVPQVVFSPSKRLEQRNRTHFNDLVEQLVILKDPLRWEPVAENWDGCTARKLLQTLWSWDTQSNKKNLHKISGSWKNFFFWLKPSATQGRVGSWKMSLTSLAVLP